jgi:TetR/AcrR family transcriptional regulator, transcriptional repressor for nem operon
VTDTAQVIMDLAERRIREAGYNGFTFRDIAAEIGVTSASIHYHFPTKDALVTAVARRYNDRIAAAIAREIDGGIEIKAAWRNVFRGALTDGARMCLCGSLGAIVEELSVGVREEVDRFFDCAVASLMAAGLAQDEAVQVLATLEGAILMASVRGDAAIFDQATVALVRPSEKSRRVRRSATN